MSYDKLYARGVKMHSLLSGNVLKMTIALSLVMQSEIGNVASIWKPFATNGRLFGGLFGPKGWSKVVEIRHLGVEKTHRRMPG